MRSISQDWSVTIKHTQTVIEVVIFHCSSAECWAGIPNVLNNLVKGGGIVILEAGLVLCYFLTYSSSMLVIFADVESERDQR